MTSTTTEAQQALEATPTAELLTKAYQLTHAMHAISKGDEDQSPRLRAMRDLITAEVLRRTDPAVHRAAAINTALAASDTGLDLDELEALQADGHKGA